MLNMLEYYEMINKMGINIMYSGPVWADGIEGMAGTLKKRLEFDELPLSASQAVFSVFVEQMNNILMYSAETERFNAADNKLPTASKGIFILGAKDKKYFIQSGNVIKNENIDLIKSRIDYLNTLGKKELRQYYKERIKAENANSGSKGAGVGFIEIAKRATSKIEYSFEDFGDGLTFFTILATIEQGGD